MCRAFADEKGRDVFWCNINCFFELGGYKLISIQLYTFLVFALLRPIIPFNSSTQIPVTTCPFRGLLFLAAPPPLSPYCAGHLRMVRYDESRCYRNSVMRNEFGYCETDWVTPLNNILLHAVIPYTFFPPFSWLWINLEGNSNFDKLQKFHSRNRPKFSSTNSTSVFTEVTSAYDRYRLSVHRGYRGQKHIYLRQVVLS